MKKGQRISEETREQFRQGWIKRREKFPSPLIGRYGITEDSYRQAIADGLSWCKDCKKFLTQEEFPGTKTKWTRRCKNCTHLRNLAYRGSRSPERLAEMATNTKNWRERNTSYERTHHLRSKFGVTSEWYETTLSKQGGTCALCPETVMLDRKFLSVDHDHKTGKVRGLLCYKCNTLVGYIEEFPSRGYGVLEYLRKHGSL